MEPVNSKLIEFSNTLAPMTIGARVREARTDARMSQEDLARRVGVSQGLIAQIESGTNQGSKHLAALARTLGVSVDWLETGKGEKHRAAVTSLAVASGFKDRLDVAAKAAGSLSKLAEVAGVSDDIAIKWLSGELAMSLDQAARIQDSLRVNAVWLLLGKGESGFLATPDDSYEPITISNWKAIPVVGMAQLGDNGYWADIEYPVGHGEGFVDFPSKDPNVYALKCDGDSMKPRIRHGEFVIIEPNHSIENGDEVLVKAKDGRVMVKIFLYTRAGRTHLISTNENHPPITLPSEEIEKLHFVAGIAKAGMWRPE